MTIEISFQTELFCFASGWVIAIHDNRGILPWRVKKKSIQAKIVTHTHTHTKPNNKQTNKNTSQHLPCSRLSSWLLHISVEKILFMVSFKLKMMTVQMWSCLVLILIWGVRATWYKESSGLRSLSWSLWCPFATQTTAVQIFRSCNDRVLYK